MVKFSAFFLLGLVRIAVAIPSYASLAGLSEREIADFQKKEGLEIAVLDFVKLYPPPPGPLVDDSLKLVNDPAHPFIAPGPNDQRGPCPGLNTLANHGYIPRSGVASPGQLISGIMEGYNLGNEFARFLALQGHLMNGNPLTNLISIGMHTKLTGPDPPAPAKVGGLTFHGTFEGDTSMTRVDAKFGDQAAFNETLFQQFTDFANRFGNGSYDINAAAELRWQLIKQSKATNPEFVFTAPRILSAYAEAIFPLFFFRDGRKFDQKLSIDEARHFFDFNRMPDGFHRQPRAIQFPDVEPLVGKIFDVHPNVPGVNKNGKFVEMPNTPRLNEFCKIYEDMVNRVIKGLYPKPTGLLRYALDKNLQYFFESVKSHGCKQAFPYGK